MEFLVQADIRLPREMTDDQREELYAAEAIRAASLAAEGRLLRAWRIPGRRSNWGLWQADDATELHEALTSLPVWRYMDIEVVALARHPNDPAATEC
jgi:muconolactone D-isomerase